MKKINFAYSWNSNTKDCQVPGWYIKWVITVTNHHVIPHHLWVVLHSFLWNHFLTSVNDAWPGDSKKEEDSDRRGGQITHWPGANENLWACFRRADSLHVWRLIKINPLVPYTSACPQASPTSTWFERHNIPSQKASWMLSFHIICREEEIKIQLTEGIKKKR